MYAIMNQDGRWLNGDNEWGPPEKARILPPELVPPLLRHYTNAVAFLVIIVAPPKMRVAA